jgi:hypothetical protein
MKRIKCINSFFFYSVIHALDLCIIQIDIKQKQHDIFIDIFYFLNDKKSMIEAHQNISVHIF